MKESWKVIPGYENYEASNLGTVRSKAKLVSHSWANVLVLRKGRILKPTVGTCGYYHVGPNGETRLLHRLVALAWIPNPQNKRTVNHIDCNKLNNKIENLEWSTHQENITHAKGNGLRNPAKGIQFVNRVKLDEVSISVIRECFNNGYTHRAISDYFKISRSCITRIINRLSWAHVQ